MYPPTPQSERTEHYSIATDLEAEHKKVTRLEKEDGIPTSIFDEDLAISETVCTMTCEVDRLRKEVGMLKKTLRSLEWSVELLLSHEADTQTVAGSKSTKEVKGPLCKLIGGKKQSSIGTRKKKGKRPQISDSSSSSEDDESDTSDSDSSTSSEESDWKKNKSKQRHKSKKTAEYDRCCKKYDRKKTAHRKHEDTSTDSDSSEERSPVSKGSAARGKDREKKTTKEIEKASSSTDRKHVVCVKVTPVIDTRDRGRSGIHHQSVVREWSSSSTDARQSDRAIEQMSFSEMEEMTKACVKHLRHVMQGEWVAFSYLCKLKPFMSRYSLGQVRSAFESSVSRGGRPRFEVSPDGKSVRIHPETEECR